MTRIGYTLEALRGLDSTGLRSEGTEDAMRSLNIDEQSIPWSISDFWGIQLNKANMVAESVWQCLAKTS